MSQSLLKEIIDKSEKGKEKDNVIFAHGKYKAIKHLQFSDFTVLNVIGKGYLGKIVKVRKNDTQEIFVLKQYEKDNMVTRLDYGKAFRDDIKNRVSRIFDHPFVAPLHFAFHTEKKLYVAYNVFPGDLFQLLGVHEEERPRVWIPVRKARFFAAEIILGLEHLHKHNVLYSVLKPEKIVIHPEGHISLMDFGVVMQTLSVSLHSYSGVPEYLAPEYFRGETLTRAVDWWALGIIIYEMLAGIPPFYSGNMNEKYDLILNQALEFPKGFPMNAQSLLKGLLQRDATKRLGSKNVNEIKNHVFFQDVDWHRMLNKQINPIAYWKCGYRFSLFSKHCISFVDLRVICCLG